MSTRFVVEQKPLLAILSSIQPICTKRTALEITSHILFQVGHKELILKGTDLEISLQASYLLKESNGSVQSFLVSGRRIFDLIKELEHEIECTVTDSQLLLRSGSVNLALNIKDPQEFPPFPERIENLMQLDAKFLMEMLNKVAFLIPQNNANPALNGLFCEISSTDIKFTATDGHCLAQVSSSLYSLDNPKKWLLPRRAIFELKKILEGTEDTTIFLGVCDNQLVFSGEFFNFFTKLLADQFPHYTAILDKKDFVPARVDRSRFVKTLRRSSCLLSGQFIATTFGFKPDAMKVSMQNKEVGNLEEELPLHDFTLNTCDIRFYAPYLLGGLQVFSEEEIQFYLKSSSKPIMFESRGAHYQFIYLVMPVAPNNG